MEAVMIVLLSISIKLGGWFLEAGIAMWLFNLVSGLLQLPLEIGYWPALGACAILNIITILFFRQKA